jgi:hypothetical protein
MHVVDNDASVKQGNQYAVDIESRGDARRNSPTKPSGWAGRMLPVSVFFGNMTWRVSTNVLNRL